MDVRSERNEEVAIDNDVARGIQRQKDTERGAQVTGCFGCFGVMVVVAVILIALGINAFVGTIIAFLVAVAVTAPFYRRALRRTSEQTV